MAFTLPPLPYAYNALVDMGLERVVGVRQGGRVKAMTDSSGWILAEMELS